jgi:endoglucanase
MLRLLLMISWLLVFGPATHAQEDVFAVNQRLGRGMNLGNALDAPREGDWGFVLKAQYFRAIKAAGFDTVRIPVRWSGHASSIPPYRISEAFFGRVDWAVDQALREDLNVIINVHHFVEINEDPDEHKDKLLALWGQIAERYKDRSERLLFELLNEPNEQLTTQKWNKIATGLITEVRKTNPHRTLIIGPGLWNSGDELPDLRLPDSDRNIIVTVHYYSPFKFTHQGAEWNPEAHEWLGTKWEGTPDELSQIDADFSKVAAWAKENRRPIFLGEFGAYTKADIASRAAWTRAIVRQARKHQMSFAYWSFATTFEAYDEATNSWSMPILDALRIQ